jgi:hypothetical protein
MDPTDMNNGGTPAAPPPEPLAPEATIDSTRGMDPNALAERPELGGGSDSVPTQGNAVTGGPVGAGSPTPTDPNLAAATQTQPASQPQAGGFDIVGMARQYGVDLSQYQDPQQALGYLFQAAQAARQNDYYTQLGRQIAPHYKGVAEYLQRQEAAQAPAQRQTWEHPEFDERWLGLVEKDPATGTFVAKPGVNPAFAERVQAYADSVESWTTSLTRNPQQALAPLIEQVTAKLIEDRFGQHQATAEAQQIIASNESWLYATDANGNRLVGADGRYVPSPLGARYYTHLQSLRQAGVSDARTLDTLAKQILQGEVYAAQAQGGQPAAPSPQTVAATARPNVNPGQALTEPQRRGVVPGATAPSAEGRSLADMLRSAMSEGGVTDADFATVA